MWGVVRSSGEGGGGQVQGKVWGQVQREGAGGCSTGGPRARKLTFWCDFSCDFTN